MVNFFQHYAFKAKSKGESSFKKEDFFSKFWTKLLKLQWAAGKSSFTGGCKHHKMLFLE